MRYGSTSQLFTTRSRRSREQDRAVQIGDDFTDRNQLAALTLHALFSHVPQTRQGHRVLWVRTGGDFIQAAILAPLCSTFSASASSDPGCDPLPAPGGHSPRRFPVPIYPAKSQSFGLR